VDTHAAIHNNLAIVMRKLGEHERALDHAMECYRLKPTYKNIETRIKNFLEQLGRKNELKAILKKV
jgi:hypothetical protein